MNVELAWRETEIPFQNGTVTLTPLDNGRTRITLKPRAGNSNYIPRAQCDTSHPEEVEILARSGSVPFEWLCDAIHRYEEGEVFEALHRQVLAYIRPEDLRGARILDFGCGRGASTFWMAKMFPESEIVGIELRERLIDLARNIAASRGLKNVSFALSPSGESLPPAIGRFDVVMLSAVYEHLLPHERTALMPKLWGALNVGGVLFINQTPHRWFPYEGHSTGLWGINYLPDRVAHAYARRFARMNRSINGSSDWNEHLRGGVRGGTEREVLKTLAIPRGTARVLRPLACRDRAEYWLSSTSSKLWPAKRGIAQFYRLTDALFGVIPSPNLDMAIRKT